MQLPKPLMLFIGCFLLPIVAAVAVLYSGWLPGHKSNQGRLMSEQVELSDWQQYPPSPWTIALVNTEPCQGCAQQWQDLQSLYVALGKNKDKVRIAVLGEAAPKAQDMPSIHINRAPAQLNAGSLYLIDHHGLVVLEYDFAPQADANRLVHKGLLKDLKKLLNYARSS
ncbi:MULTISPECIES: transmembrane cytochrome oxidase associated protein [unclassified Pseudoalteromonas]|uniref:transmembrane cytochrome oxidase associated protein n=1 Tax=unclassified Pseudoalteromonas TaxID=194690 RepID=UPI000CF6F56F|nr:MULTISPECIES: transmembrane cytochrome oxidase associated protein [unclassified Pseudoalteromonas]